MSDNDIINEAVEAACMAVWNEVWHSLGEWPDGCPDPDTFRKEELEALIPALLVLKDHGVLNLNLGE